MDGGAENREQFDKLEKNLTQDNLELGRTPTKKRPKLEIRSPAVEVDYEATMAQIAENFDANDPDFAGSLNGGGHFCAVQSGLRAKCKNLKN